jgi:hypothetical protein
MYTCIIRILTGYYNLNAQCKLNNITEIWKTPDKISKRKKTKKGHHSREYNRKTARKKSAWKIPR